MSGPKDIYEGYRAFEWFRCLLRGQRTCRRVRGRVRGLTGRVWGHMTYERVRARVSG